MRIYCVCCGKQAIDDEVNRNDLYVTTLKGARPGFNRNECYCGYCSEDLDENGLFPEELALIST